MMIYDSYFTHLFICTFMYMCKYIHRYNQMGREGVDIDGAVERPQNFV